MRMKGPVTQASYWLVAPAFLLYSGFVIIPALFSIYYSLTSWDGISPVLEYVGIRSVGIDSTTVLDQGCLDGRDGPSVQAWLADALGQVQQMIVANLKAKQGGKMAIILEYIDRHYAEQITLQTISRIACMNPNYFSVVFKKHTGTNFKDYLTRIRMESALRLLLTTDLLVYEIAERVGFNDAKYFGDVFKKYYGKNPLEYRRDALRDGGA